MSQIDGERFDLRRSAAWVAAIAGPILFLVVAAWLRRWTTDDAFINYRIVDQIRAGHGPVFNAGERVETATSTLWLALLLAGDLLLPLRIEYVAFALSIPLAGAGLAWMSIGARRLLTPPSGPADVVSPGGSAHQAMHWLPAGALLIAAMPPVWDFTTSGLEMGLVLAWTGLLTLGLAHAADGSGPVPRWVFLVAGLGPLVRPDCALPASCVLVFVIALSWRRAGPISAVRGLATAAAIPVAYQVFRMAYYAALVPNTALAKGASRAHWTEGWAYLADFVGPYRLYLPVAALALVTVLVAAPLPRPRRVAVAVLPIGGLLQALFIVRAGGDYMHARLLLPALFAVVAPIAVLPVPPLRSLRTTAFQGSQFRVRTAMSSAVLVLSAAVVVWAVVIAGAVRDNRTTYVGHTIIADGRQAVTGFLHVRHPVTAEDFGWGSTSARALALRAAPISISEQPIHVEPAPGLRTPVAALYGIGVTGYSVGPEVDVLDLLGLGDPLTARMRVSRPGFIGHERPLPEPWLAARLSRAGLGSYTLSSGFVVALYVSPPGQLLADTTIARAVLNCPPLRRLRAATGDPLTLGLALSNVRRSFELTELQVDPDPKRAQRELC